MDKKKNLRMSTMQKVAVGFFGVIFLGGVLLWLPISNQQPIAFIDALFTSTTAVCVTGLVTIVPATQFTLIGKIILLLLIQVGGLGVIACMVLFLLIVRKRITVKERVMIQESYGMNGLNGMVSLVKRIVKGTLIVEGVGAICYCFQFVPEYGPVGIWYSIFQSVSSFCNAGIDILGDSSFNRYVGNPIVSITTMALIVLGGIGFLVWSDVTVNVRRSWKEKLTARRFFRSLQLHTQIALVMTVLLLIIGTVSFLLLEYNNPETLGSLKPWQKVMAAGFQSVTTRTAGYTTVPQGSLKEASMLIGCMLMFIGGSPVGTAGGVKTTTVAMLLMTTVSVIRGGNDTECFGRKIAPENIRTGFCVVMVFFLTLLGGTLLVTILEGDVPLIRILYETTSAIGTVGLTADLTPHLSAASKCAVMGLMYLGRIGPITMALVFGAALKMKDKVRELPVRKILVG